MRRHFAIIAAATVVSCLFGTLSAVEAKVGTMRLAELIRRSDSVVVAQVRQIVTIDGLRIAQAVPQEVLKGTATGATLYFVADRTWTCDTSTAQVGEAALLFLNRAESEQIERRLLGQPSAHVTLKPLFRIAHSGRGRMPLCRVKGQPYVVVPSGVELPAAIKTIERAGLRLFNRAVRLADLGKLIATQTSRLVHS